MGNARNLSQNIKIVIKCNKCEQFYHSVCAKISFTEFSRTLGWTCVKYCDDYLPFAMLDDEHLHLTMQGKDLPFGDHIQLSPSFTIKTLLDKIGGTIETRNLDFLSDTVSSKYYTPSEFLASKFDRDKFSIFHLNIASINAHIDDLRILLDLLGHSFKIIGITETKIRESVEPTVNIDIEGYEFKHTPTKSHFGGAGIYIRKDLTYHVRNEYSKSIQDVAESIFIEIQNKLKKNILVGCIYRHQSAISEFINDFLEETLIKIDQEKVMVCTILGDLNVDVLHVDTCPES